MSNWHGLTILEGGNIFYLATPGGFIMDNTHPDYKWICAARYNTCVYLVDDGGTRFDSSDDRMIRRFKWTNQNGLPFEPEFIYTMAQDQQGRIWIGTNIGAAYIDTGGDYFTSDAIVQPDVMDENGENPITALVMLIIPQRTQLCLRMVFYHSLVMEMGKFGLEQN